MSDPNNPDDKKPEAGGEVVSLDEARKQKEKAAPEQPSLDLSAFWQPVMAAIARELGGTNTPAEASAAEEVARAKTAALLKGFGDGLGQALSQAFGKWAKDIQLKINIEPPKPTPVRKPLVDLGPEPPAVPGADPDKPEPQS
jgi:hypothetical protein